MRLLMFLRTGQAVKMPVKSTAVVENEISTIQILTNGNLMRSTEISANKKARFDSTCAFDAVAQIIAVGMQDFPAYANALQNSESDIVNVAKQLTKR